MKVDIGSSSMVKAIKILSKIKNDILIDVTGDIVTLLKNDKETTLKAIITGYSYENGKMMLPNEITELIKRLKGVQLTLSDEEIKTDTKTISFQQKPIKVAYVEPSWEKVFQTTEKELHRMLEVKYAMAQDETRPILCGVYFNENETCAVDGYRLSVRKGSYESNKSFVVNKNTVLILDNLLDINLSREVTVYYDNGKAKFSIGSDIEVIGDILEGDFIKYKQIIPTEYNHKSKPNINELKAEMNFLSSIKTNYMGLVFTETKLILNTQQCKEEYDEYASNTKTEELQLAAHNDYVEKYNAWAKKKVNAESKKKPFKTKCPEEKNIRSQKLYKLIPLCKIMSEVSCDIRAECGGEPFNIAVNYKYLNDSLKTYTGETEFRMSSSVSPIVITNDGENLELVSPIRIPK